MIVIRPAKKRDWPTIKRLVRKDPNLQHDKLPHWSCFVVVARKRGRKQKVKGCCALLRYERNDKFSEIRSFTCEGEWYRKRFSEILVQCCLDHAHKVGIYEVLAAICEQDKPLFRRVGFRRRHGQKHALLMSLKNRQPFELKPISGVKFVRATTSFHWEGIKKLTLQYKRTLIQWGTKLFPLKREFIVAIADGEVIGCVALTRCRRKKGKRHWVGEVRTLVVDRKYKGQGIGRELIMRCVNWAINIQLDELLTITGKKALFERLGFGPGRGSDEAWFVQFEKNGG